MPLKIQHRFRLPAALARPRHVCSPAAGQVVVADDHDLWHIDWTGGRATARFTPLLSGPPGRFLSPQDLPDPVPSGGTPIIAGDFGPFRVLAASRYGKVVGWDCRGKTKVAFETQHPLPRTLCFDAGTSVLYVGCGEYRLDGSPIAGAWLEAWVYRAGAFEFDFAAVLPGAGVDGLVRHPSEDFDGLVCFTGHASQRFGFLSVVDRATLRVVQHVEVPVGPLDALAAKDDRAFLGAGGGVLAVSLADGSVRWELERAIGRFAFDDDQGLYMATGEVIATGSGKVRERFDVPSACSRIAFDAGLDLVGVGPGELTVWAEPTGVESHHLDPIGFPQNAQRRVAGAAQSGIPLTPPAVKPEGGKPMATMSLYPGLPIPAFFELHGQPLVVNNPLRPALLYNGRQWVGLYDPRWRLEADQISRREWDELLNGAAPPEGV